MAEKNDNEISGRVGLDTTNFKAGISDLNQQIRVIDSGFKAAAAGMGDWGSSAEGLQSRIDALTGITDLQRKKVEALTEQYKKVAEEKGEDSKAARDLEIRINKETESLNKNQKELQDTTSKLDDFGEEEDDASDKTHKFDGALGKIAGSLGSIGGAVGKAAIAGVAAVGAAAVAAAAGIFKMATASSEYADGIQKASDVTGLSAERIQELTYAGANLGVEFETIAGAQAKLTKSMDAAKSGTGKQAEAFKALGIAVTDANGNLRSSQDVMNEAFTKLNGIGNETKRDALAMQLFGKSAMELNPLIKAGGDELARLTAEAQKNGAVISGEQIAALDAFGDSIENLKMSGQGLAANITMSVLPALNGIISNVQNVTSAIGDAVKTGDWSQVGSAISEGLNSVVQQVTGFLPNLATIGSTIISGLASTIVAAVPQVLPPIIDATVQLLGMIVQVLQDNGPMLISAGTDAVMTLVGGLVQSLPMLIDVSIKLIMALANGMVDNLPEIMNAAVEILLALVDGILALLPELVPAAIEMIVALAKGLIDALPKLVEKIPQIIETIVNILVENFPLLVDAALQIIQALQIAIIENLPIIIEAAIRIIGALVTGILGAVVDLVAVVPQLFKSLLDTFKKIKWGELGLNIINGIIEGIKKAAENLANSVVEAAKGALNAAKSFLGIHSPSSVMRDQIGAMIGAGMAEGIADSARQVNSAMNGLNKQLIARGGVNMTTNADSVLNGSRGSSGAFANNSDLKRLVALAEGIFEAIAQQPAEKEIVLELDGAKMGRAMYVRIESERQRLGVVGA